ncbi:MAG: DHH family phosphoesterase [Planctomycetota bacterium]
MHEPRPERAGGVGTIEAFGLPKGVRALDHLAGVLAPYHDGKLLILTHRSPDPDALGAMIGVETLLREAWGVDSALAAVGRIYRAENVAMVEELGLELVDYASLDPSEFRGAILVDSQPSFGHTELFEGVPLLAVLDHHQLPDPGQAAPRAPHFDVRLGVGSTSSIVFEYLVDAGVELDERTSTALCCGVRFDTADLSVGVTDLDQEAFFECFRRADRAMLSRITHPPLSPGYYQEVHRSLSRARRVGPLVYGLLGRVMNPESVAEMADFFLRMEGCRWSLVGGAFEGNYHLSLRTAVDLPDAYARMAAIVDGEGSFGGRGSVAGGQIKLENGDDKTLRALERRLRGRALKLVRPDNLDGSDPRMGTRLTRL